MDDRRTDVAADSCAGRSLAVDATSDPASDARASARLSVIVPVAAGETRWETLLADLAVLTADDEILLVGTVPATERLKEVRGRSTAQVRWLTISPGRARQMNHGANSARNEFLWFLHADTRLSAACIDGLRRGLRTSPGALHYFSLRFQDDGPAMMGWNAAGAGFRSRVLGMPFGDQGLCLRRELFDALGRYDEAAAYGEDHLLVWAARRRGVLLRCTGEALFTSARKYRDRGWLRTTARHLALTVRQAAPQWLRMWKERISGEARRRDLREETLRPANRPQGRSS